MSQLPQLRTDHLVYAVPDLGAAIRRIAAEWGVRPAMGGKHPSGTHNALLALGPHTYLEVIAPDPEQAQVQGRSFGLDNPLERAKLVTWAVATDDLDATIAQARQANYDPGETMNGARSRPDGVQLSWRSTRIAAWPPAGDGVVPFVIEWGQGTPHPSSDAPQGCLLRSLVAEHPAPHIVQSMLDALGLDLAVSVGETPALIAEIETPRGLVTLR